MMPSRLGVKAASFALGTDSLERQATNLTQYNKGIQMATQFSRFNILMAAIVSEISAGMSGYQVQQMRSSYKSRGHGIGKHSGKTWRLKCH
jgi:hypothetical protein